MNKTKILLTIFIFLLSSFSFLYMASYKDEPIYAQSSCPSDMDPNSIKCRDYLLNQLDILEKQKGTIQKQLKDEEYQQLSLQEKISYINNQIDQTEKVIKSLEVEIAASDVEIKLLEKSIQEKEDNISLLKQEINILEKSVTKRVTESYKYSFVGPLELFLDMQNLSNILRKTKYLAITRSQDKKYLEEYGEKVKEIKEEGLILSENKAQLQITRNSIEEEKIVLAENRKTLNIQKVERENLLAESKIKEASLIAAYQKNLQQASELDKAIITWINNNPGNIQDRGPVTTASIIGQMGNTGCSNGSHLHFGLNSGTLYPDWGYFYSDVNPFSNGYLRHGENSFLYWASDRWYSPFLHAGSGVLPLEGSYILMTQTEHQGNAIDMVSYSRNSWGYKNEGAAVHPIMSGNLKSGTEGVCGGKYAQVTHTNGMVSIYLHLK